MTVDEFISNCPPASRPIMDAARQLLKDSHPGIEEKMRYRIPFYDYKGMLFFLNPRENFVELGICNGDGLFDEEGVLSATDRKVIRHLLLYKPADAFLPSSRAIVQQAILFRDEKGKKVKIRTS